MLERGNIERKITGIRNLKGKRGRREVGQGVEIIGTGDQEDKMRKGKGVMKKGEKKKRMKKVL
jgi:hypothetical protein